MKNFTFYNPTKVVFGTGNLPAVGEETKTHGKKALLVYGKGSIKKNGLYDQVVDSLKNAGIKIVEHGGVKANPVLSHAQEGAPAPKRWLIFSTSAPIRNPSGALPHVSCALAATSSSTASPPPPSTTC